jgi:uncharacterized membrane protein YeiB
VTSLIASVLASLPTWALSAVLDGHVSDTTNMLVGLVVWSILFVPAFIWVKKLREGL